MTVSEAISKSGITPSASYTGTEAANDFLLAFQTESTQTKESQWIVCADHVKEHSGSLNATTEDTQYPAHSCRQRRPLRGRRVSGFCAVPQDQVRHRQ